MVSSKKIISISVCFLMGVNFSFANVYKKNLTFVNCTSADIQMDTISNPYKFSLSPTIKAKNGYSEAYSLTIPSQSVLKYQHMSVYFNGYMDGSINFNFSGGVNGHAIIEQQRERILVSGLANCPMGGNAISITGVNIDKIVGLTDDSPDIEFLNAEQIVSIGYNFSEYTTKDAIVINLGCYSRN